MGTESRGPWGWDFHGREPFAWVLLGKDGGKGTALVVHQPVGARDLGKVCAVKGATTSQIVTLFVREENVRWMVLMLGQRAGSQWWVRSWRAKIPEWDGFLGGTANRGVNLSQVLSGFLARPVYLLGFTPLSVPEGVAEPGVGVVLNCLCYERC